MRTIRSAHAKTRTDPATLAKMPQTFLRFRNDFTSVDGEPLVFDLSADERFVLLLDGEEIARGPNRGLRNRWHYQSYRVADLTPGAHRLEAVCWLAGTNDRAFSLPALMRSYATVPTEKELAIRVRLPHCHGVASEESVDVISRADRYLKSVLPHPVIRAELNFTRSRDVTWIVGRLYPEVDAAHWIWSLPPQSEADLNRLAAVLPGPIYLAGTEIRRGSRVSSKSGRANGSRARRLIFILSVRR